MFSELLKKLIDGLKSTLSSSNRQVCIRSRVSFEIISEYYKAKQVEQRLQPLISLCPSNLDFVVRFLSFFLPSQSSKLSNNQHSDSNNKAKLADKANVMFMSRKVL